MASPVASAPGVPAARGGRCPGQALPALTQPGSPLTVPMSACFAARAPPAPPTRQRYTSNGLPELRNKHVGPRHLPRARRVNPSGGSVVPAEHEYPEDVVEQQGHVPEQLEGRRDVLVRPVVVQDVRRVV